MSKWLEDECVGCPKELGCMGNACPNRNVPHYDCDSCGEELNSDELYDYEGEMLCDECLLSRFQTIADKE